MSKATRQRLLRRQQERLARSRKSVTVQPAPPGGLAKVVCEGCGLQFEAEMPVMGFELVVEYLDEAGNQHQSRSTVEESSYLVACPRPGCNSGGRVINEQHGYDSRGVRYDYFASTEAEKQAVREAMQLVDEADPLALDVIIAEFERRGGVLASLAVWLRQQAASVPRLILEVVITVILTELLAGHGVTAEELDRLLEKHLHEHHHEQPDSPKDRRESPNAPLDQPGKRSMKDH